jgi:restriction endonuclease Mrr
MEEKWGTDPMKMGIYPSEERLQQAVLNVLATLGCEAAPSKVYPLVTSHFEHELSSDAHSTRLKGRRNKWHNRIQFARQHLNENGCLSAPRKGIWKLTPFGEAVNLQPPFPQPIRP